MQILTCSQVVEESDPSSVHSACTCASGCPNWLFPAHRHALVSDLPTESENCETMRSIVQRTAERPGHNSQKPEGKKMVSFLEFAHNAEPSQVSPS